MGPLIRIGNMLNRSFGGCKTDFLDVLVSIAVRIAKDEAIKCEI